MGKKGKAERVREEGSEEVRNEGKKLEREEDIVK